MAPTRLGVLLVALCICAALQQAGAAPAPAGHPQVPGSSKATGPQEAGSTDKGLPDVTLKEARSLEARSTEVSSPESEPVETGSRSTEWWHEHSHSRYAAQLLVNMLAPLAAATDTIDLQRHIKPGSKLTDNEDVISHLAETLLRFLKIDNSDYEFDESDSLDRNIESAQSDQVDGSDSDSQYESDQESDSNTTLDSVSESDDEDNSKLTPDDELDDESNLNNNSEIESTSKVYSVYGSSSNIESQSELQSIVRQASPNPDEFKTHDPQNETESVTNPDLNLNLESGNPDYMDSVTKDDDTASTKLSTVIEENNSRNDKELKNSFMDKNEDKNEPVAVEQKLESTKTLDSSEDEGVVLADDSGDSKEDSRGSNHLSNLWEESEGDINELGDLGNLIRVLEPNDKQYRVTDSRRSVTSQNDPESAVNQTSKESGLKECWSKSFDLDTSLDGSNLRTYRLSFYFSK